MSVSPDVMDGVPEETGVYPARDKDTGELTAFTIEKKEGRIIGWIAKGWEGAYEDIPVEEQTYTTGSLRSFQFYEKIEPLEAD